MKYLLLTITVVLIISSCSGGGSQHQAIEAVQYTSPVSQVTIKGDSMAAGGAGYTQTDYWSQWGLSVENDGVSGATLDYLINNTVEHRSLKTVVLWAGYNNLKHPEQDVPSILALYSQYMNSLTFSKLICVGVPYNATMDNSRVDAFNNGVKLLCPHFVDTSDIPVIDGVHPTAAGYMTVGQRIGGVL
jgi:lysophospholipase L1-like esterase